MGIINVAFNATGSLLNVYSGFAKCLRKNGNTVKKFISFKKACDSVRREVLLKILIEFGISRELVRLTLQRGVTGTARIQ